MFRSLFLRGAAVVASLIFLVPPAFAAFDSQGIRTTKSRTGMDLSHARVWVDVGCTDSFNVPNTTWATRTSLASLTTVANWDTMEEAVNPDENIGDAVQTSGSADGWCDATPWVIKGSFTMGASQNLFLGPFLNIPKQGFLIGHDFDTIVTNYSFWIGYRSGLGISGSTGVFQSYIGHSAATSLTSNIAEVTPITASLGSQYVANFDNAWFVQGRRQYLNIRTTGAGAFTFSMETVPLQPFYEEQ